MKYLMKDEKISHISMFHRLNVDGNVTGNQNDCRLEDFLNYIDYCKSKGFDFISIDDLISMDSLVACHKKAVITFDDGWKSVYTVAFKELNKRRIPFICFIVSSFIDKDGFITKKELFEMSQNSLCTIGLHSDQHIFWRGRKSSELIEDYLKCKRIVTNIIGYEPKYYAFPYGSFYAVSSKNIKTIKNFAPKAIFLTAQRKLRKKDIEYPLRGMPRLDIAGYYRHAYKSEYKGLHIGN